MLWSPGRAAERIDLAREIAELAERTGDAERHAEGLLLTANALLEEGSAAFRAALTDFFYAVERFGQPRYDYLALTRRGGLAMIDGRLHEADELIAQASALGERIGEPDTGNVRMSQLLGLVRARGEPAQLRATAAEAIRWWIGVPSHAHAVAAGFLSLAGEPDDLAAARRALDTVVALGTWRDDRSYLWSGVHRGNDDRGGPVGRPGPLRRAARRARADDRRLWGQRCAGLLHGQQRALGRPAGRGAGPHRRRPTLAGTGADRAPATRRDGVGGRDQPRASRTRGGRKSH